MRMRTCGTALVIETPAKVNLSLRVTGKRPDGFHELETLMLSVGLFDRLTFEPAANGIHLACDAATPLKADENNLVLKAARLLAATHNVTNGVKIRLRKSIPMQAGMGGGSSDAAATLVGLNEFWNLKLDRAGLHALAARLGSDVNFFLDSVLLAHCTGRGENVSDRPLRGPLWLVICRPPVGLSTAEVFRKLDLGSLKVQEFDRLPATCAAGSPGGIGASLVNDLETPSRAMSMDVEGLLTRMQGTANYGSAMTGSGSACFALVGNRLQASRAAKRLARQGLGEVFVVQSAV